GGGLSRVIDALPGQCGDVDEAVDTTEIDEGAEVDDGGHDAGADLALLQGLQEVVTDRRLGLLEPGTARQAHIVAVLVELADLGLDLLADVGGEVADATHLDQRRGQGAAESEVVDQSGLADFDGGAAHNAVVYLALLDVDPGALVLSALLREHETAFLVLLLENEGLDLVPDLVDFAGIDIVLDGQLAGEDDAFRLVSDVNEDVVAVNLDDGSFDDVTIVEVLDGLVDGGEKVLSGSDVVNSDLLRLHRFRRGGGHIGRDSDG